MKVNSSYRPQRWTNPFWVNGKTMSRRNLARTTYALRVRQNVPLQVSLTTTNKVVGSFVDRINQPQESPTNTVTHSYLSIGPHCSYSNRVLGVQQAPDAYPINAKWARAFRHSLALSTHSYVGESAEVKCLCHEVTPRHKPCLPDFVSVFLWSPSWYRRTHNHSRKACECVRA